MPEREKRERLIKEVVEEAALYCLGQMTPAETEKYRWRLEAGCALCTQEFRECEAAMLAYLGRLEATPPEGARQAALAAAMGGAFRPGAAPDGEFAATEVPGVSMREIFGLAQGPRAKLVRLEPGAAYPRHEHQHNEHCYVLDGRMQHQGVTYGPGYCEAYPPGTSHEEVTSPEGCLILVVEF